MTQHLTITEELSAPLPRWEIMPETYKAKSLSESPRSFILRELRSRSEERKRRHENVLGRFLQCPELQLSSALVAKAMGDCSHWRNGRRLLPPGGALPLI